MFQLFYIIISIIIILMLSVSQISQHKLYITNNHLLYYCLHENVTHQ